MDAVIKRALEEDIGPGDATTNAIVAPDAMGEAILIARSDIILAGMVLFKRTFLEVDPTLTFVEHYKEGDVGPTGVHRVPNQGSPGRHFDRRKNSP